jgi:hypothetical protein
MAVASGAGMLSSTLLTLVVVPVFYLTLDDAIAGVRRRLRRLLRRGEAREEEAYSGRTAAMPAADTRLPVSTVRVGE